MRRTHVLTLQWYLPLSESSTSFMVNICPLCVTLTPSGSLECSFSLLSSCIKVTWANESFNWQFKSTEYPLATAKVPRFSLISLGWNVPVRRKQKQSWTLLRWYCNETFHVSYMAYGLGPNPREWTWLYIKCHLKVHSYFYYSISKIIISGWNSYSHFIAACRLFFCLLLLLLFYFKRDSPAMICGRDSVMEGPDRGFHLPASCIFVTHYYTAFVNLIITYHFPLSVPS